MNTIVIKPDSKFNDGDRLEHLYAIAALLIEYGELDPLKNALSVAQVIGDDIQISFASIMNESRKVIDKLQEDPSEIH